MNKTRKTKLYVILMALVCVIAFCLCACSGVGADGANGTNGKDGANGKSAYEIWLDEGHTGSQADFLNWLKGADGRDGQNGSNGENGQDGKDGVNGQDGSNGQNGTDGKSAYQIWLDNGHTGTEAEFLDWLKGQDGKNGSNGVDGSNGKNGADGKSAYQVWLDNGHTGTEAEFLDWLKGADGAQGSKGETGAAGADGQDGVNGKNGLSAYEIFLKYYPYYAGTEEQWINSIAKGELKIHKITFKSEASDDIYRFVFEGYALTDIPEVPEKEGQTSAVWSVTDFSSITEDTEVTAVYDMRKYITFHNEYTDDEDIVKIVEYGEAITDIPQITAKEYNDSQWSVTDFSEIKTDLLVEAIYQTQGLQYILINQQTQYRVSKGDISDQTTELFIPSKYNGKPVTVIDTNAFSECQFFSAHIPHGVVEIRSGAFFDCSNLASIEIPNSVTSIGESAFYNCSRLTSVNYIGDIASWCGITFIDSSANPLSRAYNLYLNNVLMTELEIPNTVAEIKAYAFGNCKSLTSVTITSSVLSIGNGAFEWCDSITTIEIPSSVTNIGYNAFYNCRSLTSVYYIGDIVSWSGIIFSNSDANPLNQGAQLYINNELVTEFVIPNTVTEIKAYAFYNCRSLTSVAIPDSVTSIGYSAFSGCSNITTAIGSTTTIGYIPKTKLQSIVLTGGTSIVDNAFGNCSSLTSIEIPNSVTSIGNNAFRGCSSLTSIEIPNSVMSIGTHAFFGCSNLSSIVIPNSVTSIGNYAFNSCNMLETIYYKGTQIEFDNMTVGSYNTSFTDAMVYFYSQNPPTDDGYYWYYDTDDKTPIVWAKVN